MHYYEDDVDILMSDAQDKPLMSGPPEEMRAWIRVNLPLDDYGLYNVWVGSEGVRTPLSEYMKVKA